MTRAKTVDPDKALAEHLLSWHTPEDSIVAERLDAVRAKFKALANFLIKTAPPSNDRTQAIYALGDASRAAIFAVVANQSEPPADEG